MALFRHKWTLLKSRSDWLELLDGDIAPSPFAFENPVDVGNIVMTVSSPSSLHHPGKRKYSPDNYNVSGSPSVHPSPREEISRRVTKKPRPKVINQQSLRGNLSPPEFRNLAK